MSEADDLHWLVGDNLTGLRRIFYVLNEDVDRSSGGVELRFASGRFLFCDSAPDGDSISVTTDRWADPFEGKMTPENIEYIASHGKLTAIDVSNEAPFDRLIGHQLIDASKIISVTGKMTGLIINVCGKLIAIYVNSDETYVATLP